VLRYLFCHNIKIENYAIALKYLEDFGNCNLSEINKEYIFYLFLMSNLIDLPSKYKQTIIDYENDFGINIKNKMSKHDQNSIEYKKYKISLSCYNGEFSLAYTQLKEIPNKQGFSFVIIQLMLAKLIAIQNINRQTLNSFIAEKKYDEARIFIINSNIRSSFFDKNVLSMLKALNEISKGIYKPKEVYLDTQNLSIAIHDENYKLALELIQKDVKTENQKSIYKMLLEDIVSLLNQTIEKKDNKENNEEISYIDIANSAIEDEPKIVINKIKNFLAYNKKSEYEFLIICLYKLGLLDNELVFSKMMIELSNIEKDEEYQIDFSEYIKQVYQELGQNNLDKSKIYLDILYHYDKEQRYAKLLDGLSKVINASENKNINNEKLEQADLITNAEKPLEIPTNMTSEQKTENVIQNPLVNNEHLESNMKTQTSNMELGNLFATKEDMRAEIEFINKKVAMLNETTGVVLLRPMDNIRRKRIHKIVESIPNVTSYSVGKDRRQIVIKTHTPVLEKIDVSQIMREAQEAYSNQSYLKARKKLLYLISVLKYPNAYIYYLLGLTYLYNQQLYKAIDCLTITDLINKEKGIVNDRLPEFIDKLKGREVDDEDKKEYFKMSLKEFETPNISDNGIRHFERIIENILINKMTFEEAKEKYGLSDEKINVIKLNLARYYFANKRDEIGEKLLKEVEKSQDKTNTVKNLFEEVRNNKKFYKNRENDPINLILSRRKEIENH